MSHTIRNVAENIYVPQGQLEQIAAEHGKTTEEARNVIMDSAVELIQIYSNGGSKSFWNSTELVALNALLLNKCLRKKDAHAATADVERFENVLSPFVPRLEHVLVEKKFSNFKTYLADIHKEIGNEHTLTLKLLFEKCRNWALAKQPVVTETRDDETLLKKFLGVCKTNNIDPTLVASKRLEYAAQELSKILDAAMKPTNDPAKPTEAAPTASVTKA